MERQPSHDTGSQLLPVIMEAWVQSQAIISGACGVHIGTETGFSEYFSLPRKHHSTIAPSYIFFIYHQ